MKKGDEKLDFYFTDRSFNLLEIVSTESTTRITMTDEKDTLSVENGNRTLTGTLNFQKVHSVYTKEFSKPGNYILFHDLNNKDVWMTIVEVQHDPKKGSHTFTAEDAGLDLLNELLGPFKADKAYPIAEYIRRFTFDSGFELGFNEIPNLSRRLEWESESMTALARLASVATQFDNAEIDFSFTVDGTTVLKKYVNVYKKRGDDTNQTLYVNAELDDIVITSDIYDLGTALYVEGGTPDGANNPINLKGYKWTDPDGRYELTASSGILKDKTNGAKWSRLLPGQSNPDGAYILRRKTYETTSQKTLLDNALRELKKISEPVVNYEIEIIDLPDTAQVGDTINLVDEDEEVFLSARLLQLEIQYSTGEKSAVLGDFLIRESGLSQNLLDLASQLQNQANRKTYTVALEPSAMAFVDGVGTITIVAKVLDGTLDVSSNFSDYRWSRLNRSGELDPDWSAKTNTITVEPDDQPLWTYVCEVANEVEESSFIIGSARVTISNLHNGQAGIPGEPGENGQTSYLHIAYADDDQGTNFSTSDSENRIYVGTYTDFDPIDSEDYTDYSWQKVKGEDGQDGIGVASTSTTYVGSTDGKTPPSSGWGMDIPIVPAGQYLWTKIVWTYTDGSTKTSYSVGKMGEDGADGNDGLPGKPGVGISNTTIEYAVNTSGIIKPTSGWTTEIPSTPQGQYLWTKTTWTYTDDTSETGYTVARQGNNGANGTDGSDGSDGIGIKASIVDYQASSSGTSAPTGTWVASPPAVASNQYLWTRTRLTMTDNSETTSYSVGKMGADGQDGQDGSDGKTTYFHRAWANSADGTADFSTTVSLNKGYLGTYTDFEETDSQDPTKYSWTELVAAFPRVYVQANSPADMKNGDQWWKMTNNVVTNYYVYGDGKWNEQTIDQAILNITTLNAVTINGSVISGSNFVNEFDFQDSSFTKMKGSTIIKDGTILQDAEGIGINELGEETYKLNENHLRLSYGSFSSQTTAYDPDGNEISNSAAILTGGNLNLNLVDETGGFGGTLTAKALTNTGWKTLTLGTNFEVKENNPPQFKIIWQLDGTRLIKFRGQFGYKTGNMKAGASIYPFQSGDGGSASGDSYFPLEIRPNRSAFGYGPTNTGYGGRVAATTKPRFIFIPATDCTYCSLESFQYIIE